VLIWVLSVFDGMGGRGLVQRPLGCACPQRASLSGPVDIWRVILQPLRRNRRRFDSSASDGSPQSCKARCREKAVTAQMATEMDMLHYWSVKKWGDVVPQCKPPFHSQWVRDRHDRAIVNIANLKNDRLGNPPSAICPTSANWLWRAR
jgi:hypothetical protein